MDTELNWIYYPRDGFKITIYYCKELSLLHVKFFLWEIYLLPFIVFGNCIGQEKYSPVGMIIAPLLKRQEW